MTSMRRTSGTEQKAPNNQIDDIFNLTKMVLKKNKILLDPVHRESLSLREGETNRMLILKKKSSPEEESQ